MLTHVDDTRLRETDDLHNEHRQTELGCVRAPYLVRTMQVMDEQPRFEVP